MRAAAAAASPIAAVALAALASCMADPNTIRHRPSGGPINPSPSATTMQVVAPVIPSDVAITLKDPAAAHDELCTADAQHPNFPDDADIVTKTFCQDKKPGGVMPTPHSLADLLVQLGLDFKDPNGENGQGGNPAFAILGHSSALTARKVSTIAPTAFVFTPPPADGSKPQGAYVMLAYDPGETFVEVATFDPGGGDMNFYLVMFDKDCTHAAGGCKNEDLLTPQLVKGWSNVRVYEDSTTLGNTILDCHVCHEPNNASGSHMLRMQEIEAPFTHWFSAATEGGRALLADFHAAHGASEDYGPIPAALIDKSDPSKLAALITQAGYAQPNAFKSSAIEAEIKSASGAQPLSNVPPGKSATWQALYDAAVSGQFIATPYHDVKVTDPEKLKTMTSAYQAFLSGAGGSLPDIRDVFFDDGLRDMGFAPKEGLNGRGLLVAMCQECHNANLDMTISREKFLVDKLDQMSRDEKDLAIMRLQTSTDTRLVMPPPLFRTTTDEERQLMIEELKK